MTPIEHTREVLAVLRERTDSVLISYSGGKDSLVVLDMAVKVFPRVECLFMYLVKDLEHLKPMLDWPKAHYVVPVRQYPHFALSELLRNGVYRKERMDLPIATPETVYSLARKDSGIDWVLTGIRSTDSIFRRWRLRKLELGAIGNRQAHPLALWNRGDVMAYMKRYRLPKPISYGMADMDGVSLRPETLAAIRDRYPEDFQKILKVFPFADAQFKRLEWYGEGATRAQ